MRYIVVDEQDQKLLASVASLLGKASFTLDSQEILGAAQVLTNLSRLAERIKAAEELPERKAK